MLLVSTALDWVYADNALTDSDTVAEWRGDYTAYTMWHCTSEIPRITSQVVLECINSLAALGQRNKVRLAWVPGHSGVAGNEEADVLARKGSSDTLTGPEPAIGLPYSYPLGSIDNWTREKCQEDWSRGIRFAAGQAS
ncbi:hypothetical protein NQ315_003651 [Exocentrus adspersus]|uniref:RNase H type-1 domain-containing protein n=1 Tax=Exocentrus adspersus TaxID=1586481 RepID=A0AAV8VCH2_9CUCU|nr:hypothetical protein NQ315_003651 [Exocentrus adspersus]